ncbi:MAG: hypothetical protein JO212_08275 [Acetobacteraceae bacterium]|nr:hypothetical protein [Acetobacteraceae bacterium]
MLAQSITIRSEAMGAGFRNPNPNPFIFRQSARDLDAVAQIVSNVRL